LRRSLIELFIYKSLKPTCLILAGSLIFFIFALFASAAILLICYNQQIPFTACNRCFYMWGQADSQLLLDSFILELSPLLLQPRFHLKSLLLLQNVPIYKSNYHITSLNYISTYKQSISDCLAIQQSFLLLSLQ